MFNLKQNEYIWPETLAFLLSLVGQALILHLYYDRIILHMTTERMKPHKDIQWNPAYEFPIYQKIQVTKARNGNISANYENLGKTFGN